MIVVVFTTVMPTDFLKQVQAIYTHRTTKEIIAIQDNTTMR